MTETSPRSKAALGLGCVWMLVTFAVLSVVHYRMMSGLQDEGLRLGLSGGSAVLLGLGLLSFWHLARGYGRGDDDASLDELLRRSRSGEAPADGAPVIATGVVRALGQPLLAPLSGIPCVFYQYKMSYVVLGGRRSREVPVYFGYASRPFAIDSAVARFRVLAVPMLQEPFERRTGADAMERARQRVASARFEPVSGALGTMGAAFSMARDVFTDDDGEAARDWKREGEKRGPESLQLEETVLPVDAEASVHGSWSAARGGIALGSTPASMVTVVVGPPEKLIGLGGAPHKYGSYVATAIVLSALGLGLLWLGAAFLPTR